MNHRKIVVTQPVHEEVLRKLQAEGEVIMNPGPDPWSPSQLREYLVAVSYTHLTLPTIYSV